MRALIAKQKALERGYTALGLKAKPGYCILVRNQNQDSYSFFSRVSHGRGSLMIFLQRGIVDVPGYLGLGPVQHHCQRFIAFLRSPGRTCECGRNRRFRSSRALPSGPYKRGCCHGFRRVKVSLRDSFGSRAGDIL